MVYLHILGAGETSQARANNKGHLFERLMSDLLEHLKITVTHINRSKSGLEIDIDGKTLMGEVPVFAECKAHDDPLDSTDIQKFGFKFMCKHHENSDVRGFLFTLSSLNSKAQEVWDDMLQAIHGDRVRCYEQNEIIELLIQHYAVSSPAIVRDKAGTEYQRGLGDTQLLCVEGDNKNPRLFWAQLLMSSDGSEPNLVAFYTGEGAFITERATVEMLLSLKPDLATTTLTCLNTEIVPSRLAELDDVAPARTVVRVRMSSSWFDYRFPAAPEFFVGRSPERAEFAKLLSSVRAGDTSARGILVSGKSGIGKSSLALKARHELRAEKVVLLPIDSRLCDDLSFLYDVVNELLLELRQIPELRQAIASVRVRGLDSLIETMTEIHEAVFPRGFMAIVFFDQFEKVFEYPDVTKAVRSLFLRITERQLSMLFGFAWKSDLWSLAEGFPHSERDDIVRECYSIRQLRQFGQEETAEILRQLEIRWGSKLSIPLHRLLAAFSRGLPWLLKKVCSHVLDQQSRGVSEAELLETNLKLQDLFEADLAGLDDEERSLLRAIAPLLPATLRRLSESFEISNIDQSLHRFIDKRILVKITEDVGGSYADVKYDAYSDIFREFLITGSVPIEDAYYFYTYPLGALRFFAKVKARGRLSIEEEMEETGKQVASIYNLSRDLRSVGLVNVRNKVFTVTDDVRQLDESGILSYLQTQLKRNRVVSLTLAELNEYGHVPLERIAELLKELFPSVQAQDKTWHFYSKTTAKWLQTARLAVYDSKSAVVYRVDDEEIFERFVERADVSLVGYHLPQCFRNGVIECLEAIVHIGRGQAAMRQLLVWLNKSQVSVEKALTDNLNLGFIRYDKDTSVFLATPLAIQFVQSAQIERRGIFRQQCMDIEAFGVFVAQVEAAGERGIASKDAAYQLTHQLNISSADATIAKLGKMMANWAEYAGFIARSGRLCFMVKYIPEQLSFL